MLGRRAFLGLAAGSATMWSLGGAGATTLRLVEIRIRVALPATLGEARVWIAPPRPGGAIMAAETRVEGDADAVEFDGAGPVGARWRPGALGPRIATVTRVAARSGVDFASLPQCEPRAETAAGRVAWTVAPGPRFSIDVIDLTGAERAAPLV